MSTIRTNAILDASGGNTATINGITPINTASVLSTFNATGSAPVYACRAWVNFNGTGTVAIRASGNVTSITDNGSGDYTVNFTTAMPDANYAALATSTDLTNNYIIGVSITAMTSSSVRFRCQSSNHAGYDGTFVNVAVFR